MISVLIMILVLIYANTKFILLRERLDTNFQTSLEPNELTIEDRFSFKDNSFNFMFALWSNNFQQPDTETL